MIEDSRNSSQKDLVNVSIALGVDIVEVARIDKALKRWGIKFLQRCFTAWEIEHFQDNPTSLAGRFAAKEAAYKALSPASIEEIHWHDVEVKANRQGIPSLKLHNGARREADRQRWQSETISISHDGGSAVAVVVALKLGVNAD